MKRRRAVASAAVTPARVSAPATNGPADPGRSGALIQARGLTKIYRPDGDQDENAAVHALAGVDLDILAGEYVAIIGPSGSGKSTLMQILGLLDRPTGGLLRIGGQDIRNLTDDQLATLRNRTIGFIFQFFNLLARTSALANVALPLIYARHPDPAERARTLLKQVGLGDRMGHAPHQLSGGQQQRVAIARALGNQPRILFADEPTGNISSVQAEEVMRTLDGLNREGVTVILVTHEPTVAAHARRVITVKDGRIVSDRTKGPRVRSAARGGPIRIGHASSWPNAETLMENLRMAVTALRLNKLRTMLTTLGVVIGVAAVISMTAITRGNTEAVKKRMASLGSNLLLVMPGSPNAAGHGSAPRFTMQDVQVLKNLARGGGQVKRVDPTVQGNVVLNAGDKNWQSQLIGCEPVYADMRAATPVVGRFFTDAENQARARVCILGRTVVQNLYPPGVDPTGTIVKLNKTNFRVLGILPVKGSQGWRDQDDTVVVPLLTAMNRILGTTTLGSIDVEAASSEGVQEAMDEVAGVLRHTRHIGPGKDDDFQVRNMADIQAAMMDITGMLTMLMTVVALLSLVVGGIGIMNIMLVSVRERTKEIGLRKALGAHNHEVLMQFLVEALLIGVLGGLLGLALGAGAALAITVLAGWPILLPWGIIIVAIVVSAGTGVVFGIWPAWQASRLSPIEALRYE